ncbi:hypothetical protein GTG28_03595 [Vibrio sp. OCN044]|uniref:Uncharacterized protein n=1 Tax=Vibrio tetraodonis subsp. pristinus TaxID=2695891 RepID=A0A6L8LR89_9VIBR|nr:hypothetical protein [Vibrio tetraodonis]MYM58295.1 hypothetical protein [Vibrio tetraodonis subsp. pristinus]
MIRALGIALIIIFLCIAGWGYQWLFIDVKQQEQLLVGSMKRSTIDSQLDKTSVYSSATSLNQPQTENSNQLINQLQSSYVDPKQARLLSDKELSSEFSAISESIENSGLLNDINTNVLNEREMDMTVKLFKQHDILGTEIIRRKVQSLDKERLAEELGELEGNLQSIEEIISEAESLIREIEGN